MTDHPRAIDLGDGGNLTEKSAEIARMWVTDGGGASFFIDPRLLEDPKVFGYLLGEAIGHGALAYAEQLNASADDMLAAIVAGVSERVAAGFGDAMPIDEGKPN